MQTSDFYQLLDIELAQIVEEQQDNPAIILQAKHHNLQKSYAFLIWFLKFYGKRYSINYQEFVTDRRIISSSHAAQQTLTSLSIALQSRA